MGPPGHIELDEEFSAMSTLSDPSDGDDWLAEHLAVLSQAAARLAPASEREELVQETLVRAWTKRNQFDPTRGSRRVWLLAILRNRAITLERRRRRHQVFSDLTHVLTTRAAEPDPAAASTNALAVRSAVAGLTRREKLAVDLFYFLDLSVIETAQVMGCSEGTVKSTLHIARSKLRATMGDAP